MSRRVLLSVLGILVLVGGFIAGLILLRERQNLNEQAAVPGGQATVAIFPTSGSFNTGDTIPVSIFFNTKSIAISSLSVRLRYPFSGSAPEVVASNIQVNSVLESSGNWNCPTKTVTAEGGNVNIDIACANVSAAGFSTGNDTLLATFNLTVNRTPATNPVNVSFDPSQSIITQKSNGQDILLIPDQQTGTGVYTIGGAAPVATATPRVSVTPSPRVTVTPSPTVRLTGTPSPTKTVAPTLTTKGGEELPSAGVGLPTVAGIGLGFLLIISALAIAL